MDTHCRITVVGKRRQVDLAVPAAAPITTYVDDLARLCGQHQPDPLPSAWSLAPVAQQPFAPERSLAELGVMDGQVLHLHDIVADEYDDPVVYDVGERVTELAQSHLERRWSAAARTITAMAAGICWLVTTLAVLATGAWLGATSLTFAAAGAGIVLPMLAWTAAERRWPVPEGLRMALALGGIPLLAIAARALALSIWSRAAPGTLAGTTMTHTALSTDALAVGALFGAILAYVAVPGVTTCALLAAAALAAALSSLLALLGADGLQTAAVLAVAAFLLLTVTPATVTRIVAFAGWRTGAAEPLKSDENEDGAVREAVRGAVALLVVWTCGLAAMLAVALALLAASHSVYGVALAGCLGVALLLRAGEAILIAEVVPVGAAGAIGLLTLLLFGYGHLGAPRWAAPAVALLVAAVLLTYGFRTLIRPSEPLSPLHAGWLTGVSSWLGGAAVGLTVATFGVFGWILEHGHQI